MDPAAFDAYYAEHFPALVGQVYAMCGNRADAVDAVQEAFTRAWARRSAFATYEHQDAWLRTVARRWAVSSWRKTRRNTAAPIEASFTGPDAAARIALHRALAELPDNQRHAIVLHYLADLPVAAIAEELGAQPGTVRVWLSRGRDRLEVLLSEEKEPHHA